MDWLTLGHDGSASDAVRDVAQAGVQVEHLRRRRLLRDKSVNLDHNTNNKRIVTKLKQELTYLRVLAALEKGRHPHETDVVVPHDSILVLIVGDPEAVVEHCLSEASLSAKPDPRGKFGKPINWVKC
jgi:hypothetical protein